MPHIKPVFAFQGLSIGLKEKRKQKLDIESKLHVKKNFKIKQSNKHTLIKNTIINRSHLYYLENGYKFVSIKNCSSFNNGSQKCVSNLKVVHKKVSSIG